MIQQLKQVFPQLSELSEDEQEKIAQVIMTTIEKQQNAKKTTESDDPLAELRNSDFIGCFSDEPDLAEKSEQISQEIISNKL
ncbi:hypothetical protein AA637_11975 [Cyanobacterium sp. HL-69]|uniref:hypothetical protein n=1 Tax=Cyanobacterium sp. HL-69 TaxID=2054282 RepID=UPI000CA373C5|nr:hypothetical protein AA637_11975 [Cyanobacterium sp. HL-69]